MLGLEVGTTATSFYVRAGVSNLAPCDYMTNAFPFEPVPQLSTLTSWTESWFWLASLAGQQVSAFWLWNYGNIWKMSGILCGQALCWWSYLPSSIFLMNLVGPVISAIKKKFSKKIQTVKDVFNQCFEKNLIKKKRLTPWQFGVTGRYLFSITKHPGVSAEPWTCPGVFLVMVFRLNLNVRLKLPSFMN